MRQGKWIRVKCAQALLLVAVVAGGRSAQAERITFAVIGDYGSASVGAAHVADMVKSWDPELILTVGDNNYSFLGVGHAAWEDRIGQFYGDYILGRTDGKYPLQTGQVQRFFPSVGNHDSFPNSGSIAGYVDYFHADPAGGRLPEGVHHEYESYYDFRRGPIHFFAVDSDHARGDTESWADQRAWLEAGLAGSDATWKFVYFHHAPFTSGLHGNDLALQWPFHQWGAHAVFSGHEHDYERLLQDGMPYFVNGVGGGSLRRFREPIPGSIVRYSDTYGAIRVTIDGDAATTEFRSVDDGADGLNGGQLIDSFTMHVGSMPPAPPLPLVGDANGDGWVDVEDLNLVRNHFGAVAPVGGGADGDSYPFDGAVNVDDLNRVRNQFGAFQPGRLPGDTNFDGTVDVEDLNNVRNAFGRSGLGDTNDDGVIDITDLNNVRNHFGALAGAPAPEPATALLAVVGITLLATVWRGSTGRMFYAA